MLQITQLPAWTDNYIYVLHDDESKQAIVIDPTDATIVLEFLTAKNLELKAILNTHHHPDHIGGNLTLQSKTSCKIYGYEADSHRIDGITHQITAPSTLSFLDHQFDVIFLPGHTTGHIAYYIAEHGWLFSGDVMFAMGCGRLFEGTAVQMLSSLKTIADLPDDTLIYCSHEYTLANAKFAIAVEPQNAQLVSRIKHETAKRAEGRPTVPTTVALEKATNPFLRCHQPEIKRSLACETADTLATFTMLRKKKDSF